MTKIALSVDSQHLIHGQGYGQDGALNWMGHAQKLNHSAQSQAPNNKHPIKKAAMGFAALIRQRLKSMKTRVAAPGYSGIRTAC